MTSGSVLYSYFLGKPFENVIKNMVSESNLP